MSLLNQPEVAGQFETEEETNTAVAEQAAPRGEPQVAAPLTTSVPAPVQASAVTVAVAKPGAVIAYADKKDVFDTATVEALSLGAKRIKGEQGSAYIETEDLGKTFTIEVISFNTRWAIGTGNPKQTSEDKAKFRISYDGVSIPNEDLSMAEYVRSLKEEGYVNAKASPYIDLWGFLVKTEKKGEIPLEERVMVMVQLSQTSVGNWTNFCTTRGMLASKCGVPVSDQVEVVAQAQAKGDNKYTNFNFRAPSSK